MKDSVGTSEQLIFVLNGKPHIPGNPNPPPDPTPKEQPKNGAK